jgi:hypothetical protein
MDIRENIAFQAKSVSYYELKKHEPLFTELRSNVLNRRRQIAMVGESKQIKW